MSRTRGATHRVHFLLALFLIYLPFKVFAFQAPLSSPLVDEINFFSPGERASITSKLYQLRQRHSVWLVVYVPKSLEGKSIEAFAVETFEKAKIGDAGKDNGLLFVLEPTSRQMRLEVGYGLEGKIPDVIAKRILDGVVAPELRSGRKLSAVENLITEIAQTVANIDGPHSVPRSENQPRSAKTFPVYRRYNSAVGPTPRVFWVLVLVSHIALSFLVVKIASVDHELEEAYLLARPESAQLILEEQLRISKLILRNTLFASIVLQVTHLLISPSNALVLDAAKTPPVFAWFIGIFAGIVLSIFLFIPVFLISAWVATKKKAKLLATLVQESSPEVAASLKVLFVKQAEARAKAARDRRSGGSGGSSSGGRGSFSGGGRSGGGGASSRW